MRIGELVERTATPAHLLRYYESRGLLTPTRTAAGYRSFSAGDVNRVARIRQLIDAGLSTKVIATILPCISSIDGVLTPLCPQTWATIDREHVRLGELIDRLTAAQRLLHAILERSA